MKFHINNVIYSRIYRSPNYRFTALIVCKSRSQRSISRMDKKNLGEVATSGVGTVEELCEAFGSTRSVEEEDEADENEQEMVPSFAETYEALQKVNAFFYAQSGSDADRENILSLEKSYFQLRKNSAKKQRTMCDFFVKK